MKYFTISFLFLGFIGYSNLHAQRSLQSVYYGNGENITKGETKSVANSTTMIHLQIFEDRKTPASNARVLIPELEEFFYCDSLGMITVEVPNNLLKEDCMHLTISRRQRLNGYQVKLTRKKVTVWLDYVSESKKVVLSGGRIVKAFVSSGGCPSF